VSKKYFGTDGIRGKVNKGALTPDTAMKIGMAAGSLFLQPDAVHRVVIGKDTRRSGYMYEPALAAGFTAMGMDVIMVGPMPTPAVAMLVKSLRANLGVMISASHNPHGDNGIKFFGPDGYKLSDDQEYEIERRIDGDLSSHLQCSESLGRAERLEDAPGRYVEFSKATVPAGITLDGLKVVVDCANGAGYRVAPTVLAELGAEVVPMAVTPDGFNINAECGSTYPQAMCERVRAEGADLGIALDGDADRLILCDERGKVVDGDQIMALIARAKSRDGLLKGGGLVATVMSNLGLERAMQSDGLDLIRTKVGDRHVVSHMRKHGYNIGGEQSGHIILSDHVTTGDGLISGLQVMAEIKRQNKPASAVCNQFEAVPQLLKNARVSDTSILTRPDIKNAFNEVEHELGSNGRLIIRKSGTEPVIRVMAEGDDSSLITTRVTQLVELLEAG